MKLAILFLALAGTSQPSVSHDASSAQSDCSGQESTVAMRDCLRAELKAAKADLEAVLKRIEASEPGPGVRVALARSQEAWSAFVDAECDGLVAERWRGGSLMPALVLDCRVALVHDRIAALRREFFER